MRSNRWITATVFALVWFSGCGTVEDKTGGKVSGKLIIDNSTIMDSDTKDQNSRAHSNDVTNDAQRISNPATVTGFMGPINGVNDISDVYRVTLLKSQTISLTTADVANDDFDLYLYGMDRKKVADSIGTGRIDALSVPADGEYYIKVYGYSIAEYGGNGGLYTLNIGTKGATSSPADHLHLSSFYDFVDNDLLIKPYKTMSRAALASQLSTDLNSTNLQIESLDNSPAVSRLTLKPSTTSRSSSDLDVSIPDTIKAIKALRRAQSVEYAEPNYIRTAFKTPNDTYYPYQWHLPLIALPEAWDITTGSSSVIVAVIDTGVVLNHPDLKGNLIGGYDFISDRTNAADGGGIDANPNDPGDGGGAKPSSFHGTHVSGTIAASSNNSAGVTGVSWGSKIMPLRVLGVRGSTDYDLVQSILFAAKLPNSSNRVPPKRADIINMSLGGPGTSVTIQNAITKARAEGVIIVVAAGNDNKNANNYSPAGADGVVCVSAVGQDALKAPYSNYGTVVDVAAPGGDTSVDRNGDGYADGVLSTISNDSGEMGYKFYQGTSMAAPHMAGVLALMKSIYPALSPLDVDLILEGNHPKTSKSIAIDKGSNGKDIYYGNGLINALKAVRVAQDLKNSPTSTTPKLSALPTQITFAPDSITQSLTLYNSGSGSLNIQNINTTQSWLSVQKDRANNYTVTVNRSNLSAGTYEADIVISSNGGTVTVGVIMQVSSQTTGVQSGDSGTVYVILLDSNFKTITSTTTTKQKGYTYSLNVNSGSYYLVAGTDIDNDGYISNEGENLGGYPTISSVSKIEVDGSRSGVNFRVGAQPSLKDSKHIQSSTQVTFPKEIKR